MTDLRILVDLGPLVQDELAAGGLMPARSNQGGHLVGADDPDDFLPPGEAPLPPSPAEQQLLAETLAAAERLTPRPVSARNGARPDPTTEYFVGFFAPGVPVYGCPGCAYRATGAEGPTDVLWHLVAYPHHEPGGDR